MLYGPSPGELQAQLLQFIIFFTTEDIFHWLLLGSLLSLFYEGSRMNLNL